FKISWISQTITWTLLIQTLLLFNKYKREDS
ncbi:accessory regulator AgrB, partial [Clostridium perfringens]